MFDSSNGQQLRLCPPPFGTFAICHTLSQHSRFHTSLTVPFPSLFLHQRVSRTTFSIPVRRHLHDHHTVHNLLPISTNHNISTQTPHPRLEGYSQAVPETRTTRSTTRTFPGSMLPRLVTPGSILHGADFPGSIYVVLLGTTRRNMIPGKERVGARGYICGQSG
jgi:hypothetical protein